MFSKGDNLHDFLFAYLEDKVFPKLSLLSRNDRAIMGAYSFFYEMTLIMGGNNDTDRIASPESVPIQLKSA